MIDVELLNARKDKLIYYSSYHFLKNIESKLQLDNIILPRLNKFNKINPNLLIYNISVNQFKHQFLVEKLVWDSDFLEKPCFKIINVLFDHISFDVLVEAIQEFKVQFIAANFNTDFYLSLELPSEDILLIQAFGQQNFRLIETRLHFYKKDISQFNKVRFKTKNATLLDIEILKNTAKKTYNIYDRLHADQKILKDKADQYLSIYAENTLKGLANFVIMPDEDSVSNHAFMAVDLLEKDSIILNNNLIRILLTAVSPECKGWHFKLLSEIINNAKENGIDTILMTTQSTNIPVFNNVSKLGFVLGCTSHIFVL